MKTSVKHNIVKVVFPLGSNLTFFLPILSVSEINLNCYGSQKRI